MERGEKQEEEEGRGEEEEDVGKLTTTPQSVHTSLEFEISVIGLTNFVFVN